MSAYLVIRIEHPKGGASYFRSMNVGVGGRDCNIAPGEGVRRATLAELRRKDRDFIAKELAYGGDPNTITFERCRY